MRCSQGIRGHSFDYKGVLREHPELKPAIMTIEQDKLVEIDESDEREDIQKLVVFTVPEVDEDRHDVLLQGVDTFYDKCKADMEKVMRRMYPR